MRRIYFIFILAVILFSCGENNYKKEELSLKERELALKEKELQLKEQSLNSANRNDKEKYPQKSQEEEFMKYGLRYESDEGWISYAIPGFMKNTTPADNMSPHFIEYEYKSPDNGVYISILVNNSSRFPFNLNERYLAELKRTDLTITYKTLKADKYFMSGDFNNGRILYEFCKTKYGNGYTYTIEYDQKYASYFDRYIPEIIRSFIIK